MLKARRRGAARAKGAIARFMIDGELVGFDEMARRTGLSSTGLRKRFNKARAAGTVTWDSLGAKQETVA